jgi:hypothetical protein
LVQHLCQLVKRNQHFRNNLHPHHQGSDVNGHPKHHLPRTGIRGWVLANGSLWEEESRTSFAWPCFPTGVVLNCLRMCDTGYHAWSETKPLSLLKLWGCSKISTAVYFFNN